VQRRLRGQLKPKGSTCHIDENFVRIAGRWLYLLLSIVTARRCISIYPKLVIGKGQVLSEAGIGQPG
jgi:transposase-like protein